MPTVRLRGHFEDRARPLTAPGPGRSAVPVPEPDRYHADSVHRASRNRLRGCALCRNADQLLSRVQTCEFIQFGKLITTRIRGTLIHQTSMRSLGAAFIGAVVTATAVAAADAPSALGVTLGMTPSQAEGRLVTAAKLVDSRQGGVAYGRPGNRSNCRTRDISSRSNSPSAPHRSEHPRCRMS